MKLEDLKGMSRDEQNRVIASQMQVSAYDMIDNPCLMHGKLLVFRGNYAGFDTKGLCVRTFEYIEKEDQWRISDIDLLDMFKEIFGELFTPDELFKKFKNFCHAEGFLFDKY